MREVQDLKKELQQHKFLLVDFYGDNCPPCKPIGDIINELSKEFNDKLEFLKVNVEKHPDVAAEFGVMSIPNLIIFSNGEVKDQIIGLKGKEELRSWIQRNV